MSTPSILMPRLQYHPLLDMRAVKATRDAYRLPGNFNRGMGIRSSTTSILLRITTEELSSTRSHPKSLVLRRSRQHRHHRQRSVLQRQPIIARPIYPIDPAYLCSYNLTLPIPRLHLHLSSATSQLQQHLIEDRTHSSVRPQKRHGASVSTAALSATHSISITSHHHHDDCKSESRTLELATTRVGNGRHASRLVV